PSPLLKALELLRNFSLTASSTSSTPTASTTTSDNEAEIECLIKAFKYLKDKVQHSGVAGDDAALVSLVTDTLIVPCYRFY
ncbi:unnamed protein product, partial [Rotaria socialis]